MTSKHFFFSSLAYTFVLLGQLFCWHFTIYWWYLLKYAQIYIYSSHLPFYYAHFLLMQNQFFIWYEVTQRFLFCTQLFTITLFHWRCIKRRERNIFVDETDAIILIRFCITNFFFHWKCIGSRGLRGTW